MPPSPDLRSALLAAWRTNNRVTVSLVARRELVAALKRSSDGIEALLKLPPSKGYVWRNLALDVNHVLTSWPMRLITAVRSSC